MTSENSHKIEDTNREIKWDDVLSQIEPVDWPVDSAICCDAFTKDELETIKKCLVNAIKRMDQTKQEKLYKQMT
jgi:hypothetical protein